MLAFDSLVIDLIFAATAELDAEALLEAMGGEEITQSRQIVDVDLQDPRFEMEVSPSLPFRRQGERRLLIIDDSVAPLREDPQSEYLVSNDLRVEKQRLLALCAAADVRLGRIFALGTMGDAVLVARAARDLRAIALLPWALDPTIDVDGRRRTSQLNKAEFTAKIEAYEKRIDELDDREILANLGPATMVRDGDLIVVDVLEADGSWDMRNSLALETALAAIDRFSLIPGAPAQALRPDPKPDTPAPTPAEPEVNLPPVTTAEIEGRLVLLLPEGRFDTNTATALGKGDFEAILTSSDHIPGPIRDRMHGEGVGFIAPLEFMSEVFVDGLPLSRPQFERDATTVADDVRTLEVHCPRFGRVILVDIADRGRFISSEITRPAAVVALVQDQDRQ